MTDGTKPGGEDAGFNLWAPPESKPSLEKGAQPPTPGQQPPVQDQIPGQPAQPQPQGQFGQPAQPHPQGQFGQAPQPHPQGQFGQAPQAHPQGQFGQAPQAFPQGPAGQAPHGFPQGQPPAGQQPPVPSAPVHDQATMVSLPNNGFGAPGYAPPPPVAPTGPGMVPPPAPVAYGYPAYPGYPQGYGYPGMPMPPQNGMGTTAMVLGILSCCLFCVYGVVGLGLGIAAVILGAKGKKRADRGEATNRGQAQAGFVTGIVGIVLGVIAVAFYAFVIVAAVQHRNDHPDQQNTDSTYNSAPRVTAPALPRS